MKLFITSSMLIVSLFVAGGTALAQNQQVRLPSAGLTPDSPFYFLDRLGENLRQFFTFNPEAKAKLQIEFAGERIAEIKVMVDKKGPEAKGIETAKSLLVSNVAYAAEIVNQEKASGKDVAALAKNLDGEFDAREKLLEQTFKDAKERLKAQRKSISVIFHNDAGDEAARTIELKKQLADINQQIESLDQKKDQLKDAVQNEQKNIEKEMDKEDQKQEALQHEQERQQEKLNEEKEKAEEVEAVEAQEPKEAVESKEADESPEVQEKPEMRKLENQDIPGNNATGIQEGKGIKKNLLPNEAR